jgi:protein ImuB
MYAVLYIPEFALQAVLRTERTTGTQPAALFTDNSKKSVVLAANPEAVAAGVEVGMTAPQAVARCPALLIRTPNADAEADARAALLAVGFTVSPTIEDTAPGVCTIDLKGAERSHPGRAARAAVTQLTALGFTAGAGIASTPLLALYAARACRAPTWHGRPARDGQSGTGVPPVMQGRDAPATHGRDARATRSLTTPNAMPGEGPPPTAESSGVSEAAAEYAPPSRARDREHCVLTVTDATSFLRPLPLAAADVSPEMAGILANWGLKTFGDLTALPRDDIGRRLGTEGLALWDRASGGAPRPLRPVVPSQTFSAAMEFEEEVETLEPLLFILRRFLERLALELRTNGYVAAALELSLSLADDTRHERSFRLPDPTADVEILFRALHTHLESLRTEASIVGVQLRAEPARPLVRQQGLFDTGLVDPHGFSETLARVVAIVGSDRVGTPQLEDTHRPDAVKLVPPPPVIPPIAAPPVHAPRGLPLRRFRPPLRAQLELSEGRPTYLWTDRFNGPIAQVRGPWLSSGEWWQADRAWRRTEYDVALGNGGLYRLVLSERAWFIEGEYD